MRLYTVHLRRAADPLFTPDMGAEFVREGFNYLAFVFSWLWALGAGLWIPAAALLAVDVVLALGLDLIGLDKNGTMAVTLGWHLIVGFLAEDIRRFNLKMRGFVLADVVAGENLSAAERRFFEHHPAMAKPAWR